MEEPGAKFAKAKLYIPENRQRLLRKTTTTKKKTFELNGFR